jgi:hypothetical protein
MILAGMADPHDFRAKFARPEKNESSEGPGIVIDRDQKLHERLNLRAD